MREPVVSAKRNLDYGVAILTFRTLQWMLMGSYAGTLEDIDEWSAE